MDLAHIWSDYVHNTKFDRSYAAIRSKAKKCQLRIIIHSGTTKEKKKTIRLCIVSRKAM
jgi:hypothetical protein